MSLPRTGVALCEISLVAMKESKRKLLAWPVATENACSTSHSDKTIPGPLRRFLKKLSPGHRQVLKVCSGVTELYFFSQ